MHANSADPDIILMLEFQKGNKAAFEALMRKYYRSIYNFIYRFLGNKVSAEDLTQEVFIRVYRHGNTYRPDAKFQTWIYTIARNLSLNELRRGKRKMFSLDAMMTIKDRDVPVQLEDPSSENPYQLVEQKERAHLVQQAIRDLPDSQRMAVILRRYQGLPYEEIAKTMDCSVQAVKSLLNRAKENLKLRLVSFIKADQDDF
jgi:RNA polymerase sigma-70 factor (ECF subfamily)